MLNNTYKNEIKQKNNMQSTQYNIDFAIQLW